MKTKLRLLFVLPCLILAGLACNLPSTVNGTLQAATLNALNATSAAQTVSAVELTSTPLLTATSVVQPSPTTPILTFTPVFTPTPTFTPTITTACDAAYFIKDVTIPDGMVLGRGTSFTKTWRIQNIGSCTWTSSYSVVFVNGDVLGASTTNYLSGYIAPGNYVDMSVNMVTPNTDGHYQGFWELLDASGKLFGIGPQANNPFWIDIDVSGPSYVAYDFTANLCNATWQNNNGNIPCPGTTGDPRGYAVGLNNPVMQGGKNENEPGMLTVPQNAVNGLIRGTYPAIQIQNGDHFRTFVNCQYQAYGCNVIFKFNYQIGNATYTLGQWPEVYDKQYYPVDLDLSPLAGQNVTFQLIVNANGPTHSNQAVWVYPRLVRLGIAPTATITNTPTPTFTSTPTSTSTATFTPTP